MHNTMAMCHAVEFRDFVWTQLHFPKLKHLEFNVDINTLIALNVSGLFWESQQCVPKSDEQFTIKILEQHSIFAIYHRRSKEKTRYNYSYIIYYI